MRTLKISYLFILFSISIGAQSTGQWQIHSDMKSIHSAVAGSSYIWAATSGGAFRFGLTDSSYSILTKADGLNSQALTAIGVDNQNKVWFGSLEGHINILDTKENAIYKIVDIFNSNKSKKQINNIYIKGDTLFASIDFGLSLINTKTLSINDSFLKLGNLSAESKVLSVVKTNLIYVATENGVAVQKANTTNLSAPESWDTYPLQTSISAGSISKIIEFNNQILLASSNGIFRYVNKSWQSFILPGNQIVDMCVSGNSLFFITNARLYQYTNNQTAVLFSNSNFTFNSITATSNQIIYISSNNGLIEYQNEKVKNRFPNGPSSNSFVNLSIDLFGNLWVATGKDVYGKGYLKYDGKIWTNYDTKTNSNLPSNAYYNVYAAQDSSIYLSNWGGGVTIIKNNAIEFLNADNSPLVGIQANPKFVPVTDCKTDSKGNLWIAVSQSASQKQLFVLTKQKQWASFNINGLTGPNNTDQMVIDQYDTKWFTVTVVGQLGLYYFNENKTLTNLTDDIQGYINSNNFLISNSISSLALDRRGYLWIGTNVGVNVLIDPSKPTSKNSWATSLGLALRNQNVTCIAIDPLDNKWIGTNEGVFVLSSDGIQVLNNGEPYNSNNSPLPGNDIKSITFDQKNGIVYIGTDNGLAALQTSSMQPVQSFDKLFVYPNPFELEDGNPTTVTIDGLVKNSSVKIFNVSGELINEINTPGGRIGFWDGKDKNKKLVPSGIYIIAAYDEEASKITTTKIAVIRK
jgi:ligand-binding sensor domain-containing protein